MERALTPTPGIPGKQLSPQQIVSWKLPRDPRISPSGDRVVFVLADSSKPDENKRSTLWMIDLATDRVRQFTNGPTDTEPHWSPDGRHIAFVSDRHQGTSGLYVIPSAGGEATCLLTRKADITGPTWSPDGQTLAFIGTDEADAEDSPRKQERRDETVCDTDYEYGRLYVISVSGGEPRLLGPEGKRHVKAYDWLPDGSGSLAAVVPAPTADATGWGPTDLLVLGLDGTQGHIARLDSVGEPRMSPDGASIAFLGRSGLVSSGALWIVSSDGGEARCLTPDYAGKIDSFVWSPDSADLRFVGFENLCGVLRTVDISTGLIQLLLAADQSAGGTYESDLSFDRDGERFAVVRSASDQPPNIWTGEIGGDLVRRTNLNADLACALFSHAESISWDSADDLTIQGLLFRPVGYQEGQKYPLVVHIHGGPAMQWSDRFMCYSNHWAQWLAQRGYAVILPNPRGSTGRGAAFTDLEVNDYGGMEMQDILTGVDRLIDRGLVDPDRMAVAGWSHGGYMTARIITQTDRFRCAIMGAGCSNLLSDQGQSDLPRFNPDYLGTSAYDDPDRYLALSPIVDVHRARTPTLILHGERDERVALPQSLEMYRGLKWAGVETQLVIYPREGHSIQERAHQIDLVERVLAWLDRFLQPDTP